jgi:hypothetical protein
VKSKNSKNNIMLFLLISSILSTIFRSVPSSGFCSVN